MRLEVVRKGQWTKPKYGVCGEFQEKVKVGAAVAPVLRFRMDFIRHPLVNGGMIGIPRH